MNRERKAEILVQHNVLDTISRVETTTTSSTDTSARETYTHQRNSRPRDEDLRRSIVVHHADRAQDRGAETEGLPPRQRVRPQPLLHALKARDAAGDERDGEDDVPGDGRVRGVGAQAAPAVDDAVGEAPRPLARAPALAFAPPAATAAALALVAAIGGGRGRSRRPGEGLEAGLDVGVARLALGAGRGRGAHLLAGRGRGDGADVRGVDVDQGRR